MKLVLVLILMAASLFILSHARAAGSPCAMGDIIEYVCIQEPRGNTFPGDDASHP